MWLMKEKCCFMLAKVKYLGRKISQHSLQPTEEKVRGIKEVPTPKILHQLKSFLGLINFYRKFLPLYNPRTPSSSATETGAVVLGRWTETCFPSSQAAADVLISPGSLQ